MPAQVYRVYSILTRGRSGGAKVLGKLPVSAAVVICALWVKSYLCCILIRFFFLKSVLEDLENHIQINVIFLTFTEV